MPSRNTRETITPRKTRVIRSRNDSKTLSDEKFKYVYEVRAEAPIDLVWAFYAITEAGYSYTPKTATDGRIIFSTKAHISDLREAWNEQKKDLHVMIETLNYVDDYTGERYFIRYWDAKKNDDDDYYCSDSEDEH
jgi:hypothetical protein